MTLGAVYELDSEKGSRLLYAAGTPEAEAWHAEHAEPHDLTPPDIAVPGPDEDPPTDEPERPLPVEPEPADGETNEGVEP